MGIERVGVYMKPGQLQAAETVQGLLEWLGERGIEVFGDEETARSTGEPGIDRDELAKQIDLAVALGGDGTLLSVARAVGTRQIPILGINLGTLGFLTEVGVDEMFPALERVLDGRCQAEERMRLEVVVQRGNDEVGRYQALNDAVVTKTALSRMVNLEVRVDEVPVTTYHADGLIVSTPTGSTAYSLSAGGPLLLPGSGVVVMTPICPHSLTQRPFVFSQSAAIDIRVDTRGGQVALTVDGQEGMDLLDGDLVSTRRSPHPVLLFPSPFRSHYEVLRARLRWGER
ncbi:MAG: NAD(+)/NADH kinase [Myxococcota bacterium]